MVLEIPGWIERMISRRKLFSFAVATAGALLVPELASSTTIFLPPAQGWIAPRFRMRIAMGKAHHWQHELDISTVTHDPAEPHGYSLWEGGVPSDRQVVDDWRTHVSDWGVEARKKLVEGPYPLLHDEWDDVNGNRPTPKHVIEITDWERPARNPAVFLPIDLDVSAGVVDERGLDPSYGPRQIVYLNRLRENAVAIGAPVIPGTYLIDSSRYHEWYRQWSATL